MPPEPCNVPLPLSPPRRLSTVFVAGMPPPPPETCTAGPSSSRVTHTVLVAQLVRLHTLGLRPLCGEETSAPQSPKQFVPAARGWPKHETNDRTSTFVPMCVGAVSRSQCTSASDQNTTTGRTETPTEPGTPECRARRGLPLRPYTSPLGEARNTSCGDPRQTEPTMEISHAEEAAATIVAAA